MLLIRSEPNRRITIVGQCNIEAALAGIALTACTAAQLVIDTARLVALGAEDEQAAGCLDLFGLLIADSSLCSFSFSAYSARALSISSLSVSA